MLSKLVNETAENFKIEEWSADKGYLSRENYEAIFEKGGLSLIPFKVNSISNSRGSDIWKSMYKFFEDNNEDFMRKYHLRSNAESGFFMIKQRFEDLTYMKDETGIKNDLLSRIICHNLCVLCQELLLLGIDVDFAQFLDFVAQLHLN